MIEQGLTGFHLADATGDKQDEIPAGKGGVRKTANSEKFESVEFQEGVG